MAQAFVDEFGGLVDDPSVSPDARTIIGGWGGYVNVPDYANTIFETKVDDD